MTGGGSPPSNSSTSKPSHSGIWTSRKNDRFVMADLFYHPHRYRLTDDFDVGIAAQEDGEIVACQRLIVDDQGAYAGGSVGNHSITLP